MQFFTSDNIGIYAKFDSMNSAGRIAASLLSPVFWVTACHMSVRGSMMLATIMIARNFLPGEFAVFSYFQLTVSVLATFASLGFGTVAARHFAALEIESRDQPFPLGTLWILGFLTALVAGAVIMMLPQAWITSGLNVPIHWLALGVVLTVINTIPSGAILGLELYKGNLFNSIISSIVMLSGILGAIHYSSIYLAIYSILVGLIVQHIGDSVLILQKIGIRPLQDTMKFSASSLKRVISISGPLFIVSILSAGGAWVTGRIILDSDISRQQFAIYTISMQIYSLVLLFPGTISKISLPLFVRQNDNKAKNVDHDVLHISVLLSLTVSIIVAIILVAATPLLSEFFGTRYGINYAIVIIFTLAAVFSTPVNIIGNHIVVAGGQWMWLAITSASVTVLILSAWIGMRSGAYGGGIAQSLSALVSTSLAALAVKRSRIGNKP